MSQEAALAEADPAEPYRPDRKTRLNMLTRSRDSFREQGYAAELELDALSVQSTAQREITIPGPGGGFQRVRRTERIKDLEESKRNCYAAARRMDRRISELEQEEDEEAVPETDAAAG